MRKVLVFALTLAIALGGIVFAHSAVTASQDDLLIYPTLELGDPQALEGMSVRVPFSCGDHLFWNSTHSFGGATETEFVYDAKGIPAESNYTKNEMELWLPVGTAFSTSAAVTMGTTGYGALLRAAAAETPSGGSKTVTLKLADYVQYQSPEFHLYYHSYNRQCSYSVSLMELMGFQEWYEDRSLYNSLMKQFRFPADPEQLVEITVTKNDAGQVNGVELYTLGGPELSFTSHVTDEGIWFIPIYRDAQGAPLPYQSPQGHGVYFVPWMVTETYTTVEYVSPDLSRLRRVIPLDEALRIDHIQIDGDLQECRMLSREGDSYVLTIWSLTDGSQKSRLEILPHNAADSTIGCFTADNGLLLVTAKGNLALVDPARKELLLTAPDLGFEHYNANQYNAATGDLRYENGRLYLTDTVYSYREGAFWAAVWQQGELLYYGEYDCSLLRGNDNWYNHSVSTDRVPLQWK